MRGFDIHEAINGSLRRMHHIQRFSSMPVIKQENVATHSWQAALVGYLVATDLHQQGVTIDVGEVVVRCTLHDISEAMSGDIIRTYKHASKVMLDACSQADEQNTYKLTRQLGGDVGDDTFTYWCKAKDGTLEGDVVRLADVLCVVTYCAEEYHMGNKRLDSVLEHAFDTIAWPMRDHPILGTYIGQMFPNGNHADAYRKTRESWTKTW